VNRLVLALIAYVGIGLLAWNTLSDPKVRLATLAVLGMFAVKSLLHRKDALSGERDGQD
jgi:hypothetical protein